MQELNWKKYRKKPIIIEAYQTMHPHVIDTIEGKMLADTGDMIIRGINGELYPCKLDVFTKTYDEIIEEPEF